MEYTLELPVCIQTFCLRHRLLSTKLLSLGFLKNRLILTFKEFSEDIDTMLAEERKRKRKSTKGQTTIYKTYT